MNGYVAIPDAVPQSLVRAAARAIREYVGADDRNRSTWYDNTLDIYADVDADGKKPHHGPAGMVQMFHHASLWAIRQWPAVHAAFADLFGTARLWVTTDRAHFKPPEDARFPRALKRVEEGEILQAWAEGGRGKVNRRDRDGSVVRRQLQVARTCTHMHTHTQRNAHAPAHPCACACAYTRCVVYAHACNIVSHQTQSAI